ncbi:hypothetical protein CGRA01v4_04992 [Colletotrichum graminicola]|nr:hypothetical protein CGRA01v4_04992 [Colletotrichum graminicola]
MVSVHIRVRTTLGISRSLFHTSHHHRIPSHSPVSRPMRPQRLSNVVEVAPRAPDVV